MSAAGGRPGPEIVRALICPFEDTHERADAKMRPRLVEGRIAAPGERETVNGRHIRWHCGACGYGELVELPERPGS